MHFNKELVLALIIAFGSLCLLSGCKGRDYNNTEISSSTEDFMILDETDQDSTKADENNGKKKGNTNAKKKDGSSEKTEINGGTSDASTSGNAQNKKDSSSENKDSDSGSVDSPKNETPFVPIDQGSSIKSSDGIMPGAGTDVEVDD